jgi:anionic cell wall polymer biosynthesis LytR-Cps2A-Psr (LCP) family protein
MLAGGGAVAGVLVLNYNPIEEAFSRDEVIDTLFIFEGKSEDGIVKPLCTFVLLYYPATKRAAIFDIPGEVGVILKGVDRVDRIDTVYDPKKVGVYKREIALLLGDEIDYAVVFDLENLKKIVDLIGGVEIFIPAPVESYESDPPALFASGWRNLNGDKAVSYLTYKLPDESVESQRLRRQRFFYAFIKKMGDRNETLKQKSVAKVYQTLVRTDMREQERLRLFDEFAGVNMDRVSIQSVAGTTRRISGQTLLLPSYNGSLIKDVVRQTLAGLTRQIESQFGDRVYTVEVLNGTAANGLAGRTAELLRGFGYDVISVGNAETPYDKTLIIDQSGSQIIGRNFGEVIRCTNFQVNETNIDLDNINNLSYRADFILIIGRDFNGRYVTSG